ncbi:tRNA pseudouridine(55) synthase TruB [Undibacterium macrobrachii]|jgi:tRNA pseudouridine55 synthase|uniref:tRNA pseudouridine synthase B n=1 Tax=Undibacterium macrobrachii TaxID=1119058 RepID=A0ABQ2X7M5_9BURK|nr:tRNA pseudouridine(55) synthase TruB [Undibacterium macrobrachii]GGX03455.1 tRNA pseudouridine synthase B [Undibacterium macrobrachii]
MNQVIKKKTRLNINGVLLLDKPVGWSSNDALIKAKRLLNAVKAGHTGTLDPFATGLLPLCFGEATKFSADLLDADKTYQTVVHLGVISNTGDTEGELVQTCEVNVTEAQIRAVLEQFKGDILQVPPMYSALKRDGKPLYEYAREGVTLEREARPVTIHQLEFVKYEAPFLTLNVCCSKGTYIRVLGEDIGKALGCGAHLNALRRTQVGHLRLENTVTLDQLIAMSEEQRNSLLAPVDALLSSFPEVVLNEELSRRFLQGQRISLAKEGMTHPSQLGRVRVYRIDNESSSRQLLGSAQLQEFSVLAPERLISTAH